MLSKFVSTRSRSFSIRLIRFRFGRKTSIERRRNISSDGQENCRRSRPFRIVVHFPDNEHQTKAAGELREAFGRYFAGRAAVIQGDLNELFRIGRRSLAIGVPILIACLILSAHFGRRILTKLSCRGELPDPGLGSQLAPARNLPLRLVADRAPTGSIPQAVGSNDRIKAVFDGVA